ncbi:MAG: SDR family NAD(P)-dependent oxidoreductase [Acidobacteria bacterium]|nr:SDR family NAD(P)-dependent oxidoreductase [Acidobacteriota bacterium]
MPTAQRPLDSPFGYRSTAADVIAGHDRTGTTAVVTGGYSGLGTETVRALAGAGAHVVVGARRPDAAATDLAGVAGDVTILPLDLAVPTSIDAFAEACLARLSRLDVVINNAATMASPLARDARGFESQLATNHLGHFQLTARLWPLVTATPGARVVALSSSGHARGGLDIDDPHFERRPYDKWTAYAQAKSLNALFALHLDTIGAPRGVHAFAVDPGGIRTPLQRHLSMEEQIALGWYDAAGNLNPLFKTVEQGAATSVWCAVSPLLEGHGGAYCKDCNIAAPWVEGTPPYTGVHPHVRDADAAAAWWAASERMTGITFAA